MVARNLVMPLLDDELCPWEEIVIAGMIPIEMRANDAINVGRSKAKRSEMSDHEVLRIEADTADRPCGRGHLRIVGVGSDYLRGCLLLRTNHRARAASVDENIRAIIGLNKIPGHRRSHRLETRKLEQEQAHMHLLRGHGPARIEAIVQRDAAVRTESAVALCRSGSCTVIGVSSVDPEERYGSHVAPPGFAVGPHRPQILLVEIQTEAGERRDAHPPVLDDRGIARRDGRLLVSPLAFHHRAIGRRRRTIAARPSRAPGR